MNEEKLAETLKELLLGNAYCSFLKLEFLELKKGYGRGRIPYGKEIANPYDTVHGGVLYSLADIVSGTVACMCGNYVTTVSGNLNFLLPAGSTEYVYCEVKAKREGKHLGVYSVELFDDNKRLLDCGEFTFFIMDKPVEELSEK